MSEAPSTSKAPPERNDPWIILMPGVLLIAIGFVLAGAQKPEIVTVGAGTLQGSLQEKLTDIEGLHVMGWLGILLGLAIVVFYLKLRRELRQP